MSDKVDTRLSGPRARVGGPLSRALHAPADLSELSECVYNHVFDAIDFAAIFTIEQMLCCLLDQRGIHDDDGEIAERLIREAIIRAASDPMRNISDVPPGITKLEAKAVRFDEGCPLCVLAIVEHEPCSCCDELARKWREQHAATLNKRGVAPPTPTCS